MKQAKAFVSSMGQLAKTAEKSVAKKAAARGKINSAPATKTVEQSELGASLQKSLKSGAVEEMNVSAQDEDYPGNAIVVKGKRVPILKIKNLGTIDKIGKWQALQIDKSQEESITAAITNKKSLSDTLGIIKETVPKMFLNRDESNNANVCFKLLASQLELDKQLSDPQLFCTKRGYESCNVTAFCLSETNLILDGDVVFIGVDWSKLSGDSMAARRAAFMDMSFRDAKELIRDNGFLVLAGPGDVVVPPLASSCLCAQPGSGNPSGRAAGVSFWQTMVAS